ncbi:MAG: PQQ-binding-like beta-propeller repeat protein [Planctomycetes bacterium]|nr:PQQ-binding-like beta-propeller repeat protein [Planctomycetota bacterium]
MTTTFRPVFFGAALWFVACGSTDAHADDWPQFRGPNRDGVSRETGWLTGWPTNGPKVLWKVSVGRGYSSVAVVKDRLYTLGLLPKDPAKKDSLQEVVQCLDAETGKPVWEFVSSTVIDKSFPGARSTPTVQGKHVYVFGQGAELYCLEAASGKVVWQKPLMKELGAQTVTYGYAASPLVVDDLVVVPARIPADKVPKDSQPAEPGLLLAFDKATGKEAWRVYHPSAQIGGGYWAAPTACTMNSQPCLVFSSGNAVLGIAPTTGKVLWKYQFSAEDLKTKEGRKGITAQEPLVVGNRVVCCIHPDNSNGLGVCLEVNGDEVKEVWRDKLLDNYTCSYVAWKGHVFGIQHNDTASRIGPLYCFDVQTGKKKWEMPDAGGAFTLVDGKFLTFNGVEVLLIEAATDEPKELARSQKLFTKEEMTFRYSDRIAPVLANGRIYCRNQNGFIVCLDVGGK